MLIPSLLGRILRETPALSCAYLVGGCVRDALLGIPVKDYDIEVFNITFDVLIHQLGRWGRVDLVGKSFGVIKLQTDSKTLYEFSLPRKDSKVTAGHKGFEISVDPQLSLKAACSRRDFTINSMLYDPRKDCLIDFFNGENDLRNRVLRHVSDAFIEDPLRVLRGMQFASRFNLEFAPETVALCRSIAHLYGELSKERIREEWFKWAGLSVKPSVGLRFLEATQWIQHYPELSILVKIPQDIQWHPEGNVFIHTCHACDALAAIPHWQEASSELRIVTLLATLTHDFGKPLTTETVMRDGVSRIISFCHDEAGMMPAAQFLERIGCPISIIQKVLPLVRNHLAHLNEPSIRNIRRLAKKLYPASINELCMIMAADHCGRPPLKCDPPIRVNKMLEIAKEMHLENTAPEPLIKGRHLMKFGIPPGPIYSRILSAAYEFQIEGQYETLDEGLAWLKTYLLQQKINFQNNP